MLLQMALFHSFLMAEHCIYVLYIYTIYSTVYMYHVFVIHSSVNGPLGCFYVLAIVNSAAVNIGGACIFLNYSFVWIYAQEWDCWIIW